MEKWLIAFIPSAVIGIGIAWLNHQMKQRDSISEEREQRHLQAENVKLMLLLTSAKLSYAVAKAIQRGQVNGEVEECIKQYEDAITEFKKFERELVAKQTLEN